MSVKAVVEKGSLRTILRALLAWFAAAIPLSFLAALVIRTSAIPSAQYGYVSSVLSFLSALIAGAVSARGEKTGLVLLYAAALALVLLTLGCLVGGRLPDTSAVLSVLSFTLAGVLLGSRLRSGKKTETKHASFQMKKRQRRKS